MLEDFVYFAHKNVSWRCKNIKIVFREKSLLFTDGLKRIITKCSMFLIHEVVISKQIH